MQLALLPPEKDIPVDMRQSAPSISDTAGAERPAWGDMLMGLYGEVWGT